ncbi:MAG TPA: hypothetical protein VFU55_04070 [Terracidiphilus sp.]|nr:hypothetical protein [Terracidiphilus sp.]
MLRRCAVLLALLALVAAPVGAAAQAAAPAGVQATGSAANKNAAGAAQQAKPGATNQDSQAGAANGDLDSNSPAVGPQPIVVTSPETPPAPWTWHDRVLWGAYLVLAVVGYVGILLALRALKRIERHVEVGAATAQAALDASDAVLAQSQAIQQAERPWILVTIEPFLTMENSFKVMATNKGKTPARIVGTVDLVGVAPDETHLPETPVFENEEPGTLLEPVILLPGESLGIRRFSRSEVKQVCKTREELERIELWEDKIFIFGRVSYRDMLEVPDKKLYQTDWCCRYIHGEKDSALVVSGPPKYNKHL